MARGADRLRAARRTPYTDRATGLLIPVAHNRSRFIAIAIRFQQNRLDSPCPETATSFSTDRYRAGNL
jgi:hypothetical protein